MLNTLAELEATIAERASASPDDSYSARLLHDHELLQRKIVEEAHEFTLELARAHHESLPLDPERVAEECADLLYHTMVGLCAAGVPLSQVAQVLEARR